LALARSAIKDELSILSNSFQLVSGKIHYHPASSLTAGKLGESSGLRIEALISSAGAAFILQNIRPKVESARASAMNRRPWKMRRIPGAGRWEGNIP
jgi:hypothetical protein